MPTSWVEPQTLKAVAPTSGVWRQDFQDSPADLLGRTKPIHQGDVPASWVEHPPNSKLATTQLKPTYQSDVPTSGAEHQTLNF